MQLPTETSPAHPLADTSALVLLWCGHEIYRTGAVEQYSRKLDLNNGRELLKRCNAVWPEYGKVIRLRKSCIAKTASSLLRNGTIRQVVIPAAGFSMLGIELAAMFSGLDVFELDRDGMPEKQEITRALRYAADSSLHCIAADICDCGQVERLLSVAGWKRAEPTLLVIEGISYYLQKESARKLWELVAPESPVIFEYLVPLSSVNAGRRHIPEAVFTEIMAYCSSPPSVTCWSEDELKFEPSVSVDRCYSLSDIDK
ncbi:MAG: hypothetical protein HGB20_02890 [Chlorobiaceae bacterium]|nr:hypothetical protein [Chlorobiaceae bacterium]